jgi:hypothetical protein
MTSAPSAEEPAAPKPAKTSDELLGDLAHELSLLVKADIELAAAQHGPQLRELGVELSAAIAVSVAALLALAALSFAAIQALALVMPDWAAAAIVGVAWLVVAGLLLLLEHPRRLFLRLRQGTSADSLEAAMQRRKDAEDAVQATAQHLAEAVARETAERELRAGLSAAENLAETVEEEAEDLLKELVIALLAPGRAGISVLERLISRPERP